MTDYRFEGWGKEWVTIEAAELDALRERAEKAEAEAAKWKACALDNRGLLDAVERAEKAEARAHAEFEIAQRERRFADDARWERDEAREDTKALATVLYGWARARPVDSMQPAWQRIRDRKLLEVGE